MTVASGGVYRSKTHAVAAEGGEAGIAAPVPGWRGRGCDTPWQRRASVAQGKPWVVSVSWRRVLVLVLVRVGMAWAAAWAGPSVAGLGDGGGDPERASIGQTAQTAQTAHPHRTARHVAAPPAARATASSASSPDHCPGPALVLAPLAPGVWWLPGATGEADAANRGQVSNLVLARSGRGAQAQAWALGSGPTPVFGAALACQVRRQSGLRLANVVSPWARPELVLGAAGVQQWLRAARLPAARHWAHATVAEAMARQCPRCEGRLRLRLQRAETDLDGPPIHLPDRRLTGQQGRLGPFDWWRIARGEGGGHAATGDAAAGGGDGGLTVWRLRGQPLWFAPGLLGGDDAPPDGRDADLALLQAAATQLAALASRDGPRARFVGEQGVVMDAGAPARHAAYWAALRAAAAAAIARGDDEAAPAPALAGWPLAWAAHPWHGFNWQRAWRQVEAQAWADLPR